METMATSTDIDSDVGKMQTDMDHLAQELDRKRQAKRNALRRRLEARQERGKAGESEQVAAENLAETAALETRLLSVAEESLLAASDYAADAEDAVAFEKEVKRQALVLAGTDAAQLDDVQAKLQTDMESFQVNRFIYDMCTRNQKYYDYGALSMLFHLSKFSLSLSLFLSLSSPLSRSLLIPGLAAKAAGGEASIADASAREPEGAREGGRRPGDSGDCQHGGGGGGVAEAGRC